MCTNVLEWRSTPLQWCLLLHFRWASCRISCETCLTATPAGRRSRASTPSSRARRRARRTPARSRAAQHHLAVWSSTAGAHYRPLAVMSVVTHQPKQTTHLPHHNRHHPLKTHGQHNPPHTKHMDNFTHGSIGTIYCDFNHNNHFNNENKNERAPSILSHKKSPTCVKKSQHQGSETCM